LASAHVILDRFPMVISSIFPKYFREGTDSPAVWDHIRSTTLQAPSVTTAGEHNVVAQTLAGELKALVRVIPCADRRAPLVIYHHGAKEFDTSFNGIFGKRPDIPAHLVLVRAPFHEDFRRFLFGIGSLKRYLAMFAVSACLIEEVISQFKLAGCGPVSVTGTSLGGFVSLVHHIHFGSADSYMPMLAGPNLAHCLLESAYSRQTDRDAKARLPYLRSRLDFSTEYRNTDHRSVFPLLGRYDQMVMPEANIGAYGDTLIRYIEKGHLTGSTAFPALREHILSHALSAAKNHLRAAGA